MPSVAFHTLGCKVNQYETEAIMEQFISCGYTIHEFDDVADIYVINTCTVTNIADQKSRQMLSKAKKRNEDAVVVAVGCYVQMAHEQLEENPFIDVLIGNTHKNQIVEIVEKYLETHHKSSYIENVHGDVHYEELKIDAQQSKTRSTIKIQDGCNQYCTYCIIPYTRGKVRSRHPETIVEEVERLVRSGYKEIILTGIHLASYGKDLEGETLLDVLVQLNGIENLERIRLGSLEPTFITRELLETLSKLTKICDHFHLSMQSGSDSVLKRMNRRYDSAVYYEKVQLIREFYDHPAITTDVIVGFPMETEEEANETLAFVEKVQFAEMHIFKYSIREGTKAASMKPQVPGTVKTLRSKAMTDLAERSKESYLQFYSGKTMAVLFEDTVTIDTHTYITGYTTNYIKVFIAQSDLIEDNVPLENTICKVQIGERFNEGVLGQLI